LQPRAERGRFEALADEARDRDSSVIPLTSKARAGVSKRRSRPGGTCRRECTRSAAKHGTRASVNGHASIWECGTGLLLRGRR
jgi:hypothetical protein